MSSGLAQLLRDTARLARSLDFFPAQLTADPDQATLVGVVDEGRLGPWPPVDPALSLILVPRHESPLIPPPSNEITMKTEFVVSVRWVADIVEEAEHDRDGRIAMRVGLSYVPAREVLRDSMPPRERQTGSALVPRVLVSGRARHRAEFADFMRAATIRSYTDQKIEPHGPETFLTSIGYTSFVFSRTGRVPDAGREVVMRPTPSEVVVRHSPSGVTVEPSRRRR